MRNLLRTAVSLLGTCALLTTQTARADTSAENAREYGIKAAFLYNFTKFVGWPADAAPDEAGFDICIDATDEVAAIIETALSSKHERGRGVRILPLSDPTRAQHCHIVFVARSRREDLPAWRIAGIEAHALIISESDHFGAEIGMINLVTHENRVQIEVERVTTERAGLLLSSSLLSLARLRDPMAELPASGGAP